MSGIESEIRARVDAFVADLSELVREAALEAVTDALNAGASSSRGRRAAPGRTPRARRRGGRRSPAELEATTAKLLTEIRTNPGQRIEQIATAIDMPTKELALPVTKLIDQGSIRREGQKRATKYFPARAGGGGRGGKKRAKR